MANEYASELSLATCDQCPILKLSDDFLATSDYSPYELADNINGLLIDVESGVTAAADALEDLNGNVFSGALGKREFPRYTSDDELSVPGKIFYNCFKRRAMERCVEPLSIFPNVDLASAVKYLESVLIIGDEATTAELATKLRGLLADEALRGQFFPNPETYKKTMAYSDVELISTIGESLLIALDPDN